MGLGREGALLETAAEIAFVSAASWSRGFARSAEVGTRSQRPLLLRWQHAARNSPELHVVLCLPEGGVSGLWWVYPCGVFLGAGAEGS